VSLAGWDRTLGYSLKDYVRYEHPVNLFYDNLVDEPISIIADSIHITMQYEKQLLRVSRELDGKRVDLCTIHEDGTPSVHHYLEELNTIKYYRFVRAMPINSQEGGTVLSTPYGSNLLLVVMSHGNVRKQPTPNTWGRGSHWIRQISTS